RPGTFAGPFPSGAPAIFADQVARLGHPCAMVGSVGDDDFGRCVLNRLQQDGVDTRYIRIINDVATGVAFVAYFADGSRKFIFHFGNSAAGQLPSANDVDLSQTKFVHVCGCTVSAGGALRDESYKLVERAARAGIKVSFDPNLRPELLADVTAVRDVCEPILKHTYVLSTGVTEAMVLTGESDADAACRKLLHRNIEIIALKLGERGCRICTAEGTVDVPAYSVDAVDPTGAGDCFDAAVVVGIIEGLPLQEIGRLANACGALATTRRGPMEGAFRRDEVERFMSSNRPLQS
ncbi:MAG TPA: sugar kinase, partial [Armatimonadetes bacterium]|nr:sugar kinase [Armatimonadota bacterium]